MSDWPGFTCLQHLSLAGCKSFTTSWDWAEGPDSRGMTVAAVLARMAVTAGALRHVELQGLPLDPTAWLQGAQGLLNLNLAGQTSALLLWSLDCTFPLLTALVVSMWGNLLADSSYRVEMRITWAQSSERSCCNA